MSYLKQILDMHANGELPTTAGAVTDVTVSHDSWCQVYSGGDCNCEPDITLGKPSAPKLNRQQRRAKKRDN